MARRPQRGFDIPGQSFRFGDLLGAQALGDLRAPVVEAVEAVEAVGWRGRRCPGWRR
jgi:hypothetical protein